MVKEEIIYAIILPVLVIARDINYDWWNYVKIVFELLVLWLDRV